MSEDLVAWHDFNVGVVTAAAALLGLLFVALSLHIRALSTQRNAEIRSVARSVFLGYVTPLGVAFMGLWPQSLPAYGIEVLALLVVSMIPFGLAARDGFRATGIGYSRTVTIVQFVGGIALFVVSVANAIALTQDEPRALFIVGLIDVLALLWGVFNTWELIFRMQGAAEV
jgi:modulator of FtsH protease